MYFKKYMLVSIYSSIFLFKHKYVYTYIYYVINVCMHVYTYIYTPKNSNYLVFIAKKKKN